MDTELLLQHLRDVPLEEGRAYIRDSIAELADLHAVGTLLADEALRLLYTPFVSLKMAELLTSFGEYTGHRSSHALGLKAKGDALMAIGHYRAAMDALDAAQDEFRQLGDEGNAARTRISWILSAAWIGRVDKALQEAARAREVFLQLGENYWAGVIDSNTAIIYAYVGRHQDEFKLYEDMLAVYAAVNDQSESAIKRSIAIAENNHARNLAGLGDFKGAQNLLKQAQEKYLALGEMALVANVEDDLANLDYAQGYYGSALRRYYQARDNVLASGINSPVLLSELNVSMANCLVKLNRFQEACQLAGEAVEAYRQSGLSFNIGNALREYAAALVAARRLREALAALDEAWMLFAEGGFDPHAYAVRLQQAHILLEMGFAARAYSAARLVKEYCDAHGLLARAMSANLIMAEARVKAAQDAALLVDQGQQAQLLEEATSLCKQVVTQARRHNLHEEMYKSHYLLGRISSLQGNLVEADRQYTASIVQIEHILDDLVFDLSPAFLHSAWSVYEDMIALCLTQGRNSHSFSYLEQARSMALRQYLRKTDGAQGSTDTLALSQVQENNALILRKQQELKDWQERYREFSLLLAEVDTSVSPEVDREVMQAELKRCEVKIGELFERLHLYQSDIVFKPSQKRRPLTHSPQVDIARLQHCLAPEQVLLAYFIYRDRFVIFALTAQELLTREVPGGVEQVERLLPLLHAHLDPRGWSQPHNPSQQVVRRLLTKLYTVLVEPVADMLPPVGGQITIVPYSFLHNVPFHALNDGTHYLIENFQVNYVPASSILLHLDTLASERAARSARVDLPANPPLVLGYSGSSNLQRVSEEAQAVAALLKGRCFLEREATIAHLIEQSPGSPVIHLATHGQSRLDAPDFSYVRLADGQLNAIDAFNLDLRGCELVTLSGCETGLSLSSGGDEQLGLGRAFLAAGATSLVMSLWPVEDNATNELMQIFYKDILRGASKIEALRSAQCSLLQRTGSPYTHPYFWAAFRLVGDSGRLLYGRATEELTR